MPLTILNIGKAKYFEKGGDLTMGLLDLVTGGKSSDAAEAMKKAQQVFENLQTPTQAQLSLPELQKYVEAGLMTPAQMEASLINSNAYDTMNVPTVGRDAQIGALNKLQEIAEKGGHDAQYEADLANTINSMNSAVAGQRGAIADSFAQRGVPLSLMSAALQNTYAGQDAAQANSNALNANANAEMRAMQALENAGNLGGNIQSQDWNQANTKAAATNAINQWNSEVANRARATNAGYQQQANGFNAENKQNVSDKNITNSNYRTEYNAKVPQTVYQDQLQKASGQAGAYQNIGNLAQQQGGQNAGIISGVIGAVAPMAGKVFSGMGSNPGKTGVASAMGGQSVGTYAPSMAEMGYAEGGVVPGHASVHGDSPVNDTVPARLSPGELIIPRSIAHSPNLVTEFVKHLHRNKPSVHPEDLHSMMEALTMRRDGGI